MRYTKMHGAGNRFLLVEDLRAQLRDEELPALARRLCAPETGPGADGLIVVGAAPDADAAMRFYNADGSRGEMCGNGARCLARYCVEQGLAADPARIRIQTDAGPIAGRRLARDLYQIRLNEPTLLERREAGAEGRSVSCGYVELGRPGLPHAVVETAEAALAEPERLRPLGRALRHSPAFPKGANVSFFCFTGEDRIRAITFERGVEDFTPACGTGCGALAASLASDGRLKGDTLQVRMPGGELSVSLRREDGAIRELLLTGPTCVVEDGVFPL